MGNDRATRERSLRIRETRLLAAGQDRRSGAVRVGELEIRVYRVEAALGLSGVERLR